VNNCEAGKEMEGFYWGPYFKYNRYGTDFEMDYDDGDIMEMNTGKARLSEYGFGIQLGYQLKIKDRFIVDMMFFGPRTSRYKLKFDFDQELSEELRDALKDKINETLDDIFMKGEIEPEVTFNEFITSFNWLSFRYGISIGYAF
jgi:hypothetical protein